MSALFYDVWYELRERRLVPVAALLLIAAVAAPVLLLKHTPAPDPVSPSPSAGAAASGQPVLKARNVPAASTLKAFDEKDPFMPLRKLSNVSTDGAVGAPPPGLPGGESLADSGISDLPLAGASSAGSGGSSSGGGGSAPAENPFGGGGSAPSGGGSRPSPTPTPRPAPRPPQYAYVADVTVSVNGRSGERRALPRLSMLPSESNPVLVFLGVDGTATKAVFLVDAGLTPLGRGVTCRPNRSVCSFIELALDGDDEQIFRDGDGNEYGVRLERIYRVRVGVTRASAAAHASSPRRARGRATPQQTARRFLSQLLVDETDGQP